MAINSPEHGFTRFYMFNENLPQHSGRKIILRATLLVRDVRNRMYRSRTKQNVPESNCFWRKKPTPVLCLSPSGAARTARLPGCDCDWLLPVAAISARYFPSRLLFMLMVSTPTNTSDAPAICSGDMLSFRKTCAM